MRKITIILLAIVSAMCILVSPIAAAENNKPVLEGGALFYTFESNVFSYKFQVKYTDADGDMPNYVFVFVNGSRRLLEKEDPSDKNSKDGIIYTLRLTQEDLYKLAPKAKEWDIEYWFRTNDGHGPVSTPKSKLFVLDSEAMGLLASNSAGGSGSSGGSSSGCGCGK